MVSMEQFDHVAGIVVLTPTGRVSRYFLGIHYPPAEVRVALVDASHEKIGNPANVNLTLQRGYSAAGSLPSSESPAKAVPPANH
jgi:protein SCO1/2